MNPLVPFPVFFARNAMFLLKVFNLSFTMRALFLFINELEWLATWKIDA
jgi:hypothetical protein